MESIERAFGIGPGGPNRETQPRRVNPDSPELIAREWQELNLARIREILTAEQDEWVKRVLSERLKKQGIDFESSPPEEKEKAREELIEELRQIKTREELLGKLKELQELGLDTTKIINLFGLVYIPDNYTVIAVTDIHGDINALEEAIGEFETIKGQGKNVAFVCMGDFVDRGDYNFEVVKRLFELKRKYQDEVIILKGDHEDDVFDIRIDKPYSIKIDGATFAELLFKYVQDRDEKIMELYVETFSKLPHAVMYRDILLTHAGIPVKVNFLEGENKCVIDEESIAIGRLIQPEKGDFREINWADIDPEIEEGVVKNIDRYHPEHLPPLNQIDLHKYSPKELTRILNQLGFSYFIRGHQYSYGEEGLLFETSPLAYRLFEESIITFHSNQSYYVNKRAYNEGCYLVLNPDGSIVAKGVEGGQERTIIQPKEEISQEQTLQAELTSEGTMEGETSSLKEGALKPQEAENQGGVEERELSSSERRELKFESLDDRIQVFIKEVMKDYEKFIKLVIQNPDDFRRELLEIIEENIKDILERRIDEEEATLPPDINDENARKLLALNLAFTKEEENLKTMVRRYIGLMLLSNENLLKNENTKNKVKEFLEKWCSLDDLIYFVNVMEPKEVEVLGIPVKIGGETKEIHFKARTFKINEGWKGILLIKLAEKLKTKEELEKYLKTILNLIKKYRNLLIENYARKYEQEGFNPQEARKKAEEFVDEFIRNLERNLPQIINLPQEELEQILNGLKGLAEQAEKAEKEGKKEIDWGPVLDNIKLVGGLLASGFLLWIAFLGFFAPLWLIERVKKDVKI